MKTHILYLALALALVLAFPGLAQADSLSPAANQTRTFQQGLNGYTGSTDTWVSALTWDTPPQYRVNYGQNSILRLSRNGGENPLLRFDLSTIPTNSAVISANLELYNLTPANCGANGSLVRRVRAQAVLSGWDEGNQLQGVVATTPGAHGATGDYAFQYYSGGTNIAWAGRGMLEGSDYASSAESYADVLNPGWYSWDITALARAWVRGERPNYGLTLRDATGYQDNNCDWRDFASAQSTADPTRRPRLTIVYNPDVPYANAGPDQANLSWNGAALTLDASASHDRPGGDDASLKYAWRIFQAGFGSGLSGPVGATQVVSFTPDVPGEWEIELTVTNNLGESASDRVHLRLLRLPSGHPRIYLNPPKLAALRARALPSNPRWAQLLAEANDPGSDMQARALVAQVSNQPAYCNSAITSALASAAAAGDWTTKAGDIAVVYDWCYAQMSTAQRTTLLNYFNTWANATPKGEDLPGWGNYWPGWGYSYALVGLATYGDSPRAAEWLDEYRYRRYRDVDQGLLDRIAPGGGWPEGMIYDWLANWPRVKALDAWRTATGENLFESTPWFRNRLEYLLLHRWPGQAEQYGQPFHPYLSTGDTERLRGSIANYDRIMTLILIERFPTDLAAYALQSYVATPPANNSMSFMFHEEFLWYNPDQPAQAPTTLTHANPALGTIFMRSGWPDGGADTDPCATYITFQSGDHYTYHQHYDQNSFTLYRCADLALDSGVYSGNGLSNHDVNYYVRTIAHNTLVVYNPAEDFSSARPDASSNDGGQRSFYPASRYPTGVEYFDQNAPYYETGSLLHFEDAPGYTYAFGDATAAYNNPGYNQAMNTSLSGNTAKVSRFLRELVYLRSGSASGAGDYLVLFDRVGVTAPAFSGANTKLLFHVLNQPVVNGSAFPISPGETLYTDSDLATAVSGSAKLFLKTLMPVTHNLSVVGGRGNKAFWVFGANYDWHWSAGEAQPRPVNDFEAVPYGEWRIELEPVDTALEHNFLNVLYPTASTTASMPATSLIATDQLNGAFIADPTLNRLALFSTVSSPSAWSGELTYSYTPTAASLNLIFDRPPGTRYRINVANSGGTLTLTLTPDAAGSLKVSSQGVLSFTLDLSGAPQTRYPAYLPQARR